MRLKLEIISGGENNCSGGQCPTVYRAEDGRIFVQGWRVTAEMKKGIVTNSGEDLIEVPADLLKSLSL